MCEFYKEFSRVITYKRLRRTLFILCCFALCCIYHLKYVYNKEAMPETLVPESYNFTLLINNGVCTYDTYLLILVHSAANHFQLRDAIRDTWGHPAITKTWNIQVVFVLAMSYQHQKDIEKENNRHHDIIQGNFIDSYRNLTFKHVLGLSWAHENCKHTKYLMKMDDDIFVDIYQLLGYIRDHLKTQDLNSHIACYLQKNMPVVRDPGSKWHVSKKEYPSNFFENYCSGWAYLTTIDVARTLTNAVKTLPYFWVDDVHLTGTVAKLSRIDLVRINHLYALETDGLINWIANFETWRWNKMFAPTWGDVSLSRKAHEKTKWCYRINCSCCYVPSTSSTSTTTIASVRGIAQLIRL